MSEPTIACPSCGTSIKLTEGLAAPLLKASQARHAAELAAKEAEVDARLRAERSRIVAEETTRLAAARATDDERRNRELRDLQQALTDQNLKLNAAQAAQAEAVRKTRELDDARRELELTVETRVTGGLAQARAQARQEAEGALALKVAERDEQIASMNRVIEDLKRRSEQGSQQLQGEAAELQLEADLARLFPHDVVAPVAKGVAGADVVQQANFPDGRPAGVLLWESKQTKNWTAGWLPKLREDARAAKADVAILVSRALPEGVSRFALVDGVWVTAPETALGLAAALRHGLLEVAKARDQGQGLATKTEMVYGYLTGPRFKQRVEAIVEAFTTMKADLDAERKVITKQWAKRDEQIARVLGATVGMYGDLQGIAGAALATVAGLELPALEAPR